ncbi:MULTISPECIES: type-F conjugative transfer system protein TraW [Herbaspirillum]|jgi:conjugal transfer pilus assembly protein TraW|uniref:Type-F conjugative transfer system protein TraW n=2 Tax=Herbaspirillum huttiense TaxID=863372 RepID=A0AAJ2LU83_9BURK|nr:MULTISPECIES: type-F conjugative transfer system protein TraW [Herbaspirillum]MDR9837065.1 type-F conjugative transfer system protein TraW [Herbaspirillum huttiense]
MTARISILAFCLLGLFARVVAAEELGQYGNTWAIQEQDAVDMIKERLGRMEKRGQLKKFWEDYRSRQLANLENPPPVAGITTATERKVWTYDPTYTYSDTVKDHLGNIIVPSGTKLNPLDYVRLSKALVFIDGRDPKQVRYAKQRSDANPQDKIILVAGSFLKLNREWKRQVYFDQQGILVKHFGLKHVPAVISQQGKTLQVEEFAP